MLPIDDCAHRCDQCNDSRYTQHGTDSSRMRNVAPFFTTAEKQAIWDSVELAKILSTASPSKTGILNAKGGIPATPEGATGMMPFASTGSDELSGQRPSILALQGSKVMLNLFSPYAYTVMYIRRLSFINRDDHPKWNMTVMLS